eukprot:scaffold46298_cov62-Phaeocystis_antarctica.AAC.4
MAFDAWHFWPCRFHGGNTGHTGAGILARPLRRSLRTPRVPAPGQCRLALGRRQRLLHLGADVVIDLGVAARVAIEADERARRHRAAPEGGRERGHPGVGDLVVPEVQHLQVGHRPLLEERGQGGHRSVIHLVAAEDEPLQLRQAAARVRGAERRAQREHLRVVPPQVNVGELDDRRHVRGVLSHYRHALGRRQRLLHGGRTARIFIEADLRARRHRAAPDGGGERGDPGVGDLIVTEADVRARRHRAAPDGGGERGHPGVGDLVAAEVQSLQVGHRPLLDERGQGGHRAVAHLVAHEVERLQLPQPAACVRGAEHLAQREHLRVVPPQLLAGERAGRRHLRGEGLAVDGRHEPHVAGIRELNGAGRDARLERRGKRRGRHRRLARGLAVPAHPPQLLLLARQPLEADERLAVLDEAAGAVFHYAPATPGVGLHVRVRARGEVGVDEEHVRLRVAVPQVDPLVRGRQRGVGGGRWAGRRAAGRWAAHHQRSLEGGELLWRAVVLGAPPGALRHRHVVEEDAHLAAGPGLLA